MGWWNDLKQQWCESWQQLLYNLELTSAGSQDLPWLDTLKFFWDSLPDADKLTTAEKRRLAHSVKLMVRQAVQDHYHQELSHKHAIHVRQVRRQQAQAEQHIEQLAERRKAEMQAMSQTARQQSLVLPLQSHASSGSTVDEQQQEPGSPTTASAAAASELAAPDVRPSDEVVIDVHDAACEILPAETTSCINSSQVSTNAHVGGSNRKSCQRRVAFADLHEPLLARTAPVEETEDSDQSGYSAPATDEQQQSAVLLAVQPIHSRSIVQSGSELLLQRYLGGSHHVAVTGTDTAAAEQQQPPTDVSSSHQRHNSMSSTASSNDNGISSSYGTTDYSSSLGHRGSVSSNAAGSTPRSSPLSTPKKGIAAATVAAGKCVVVSSSRVQC